MSHARRWIVPLGALVVLLGAADALLLGMRLASLREDAALAPTTGIEEPALHGIWRAQQGLPVYRPAEGAASLPLYNWLFYAAFGAATRIVPPGPESVLLYGRLFNALLLLGGAAAHYALTRLVLRSSELALPRAVVAAVVLSVWFGSGLVRWYALTARADGGATAAAVTGLLLFLLATGPGSVARATRLLVGASCAFFLAWSFKQSVVLLFAGCLAFLVLDRRFRAVTPFAAPFFVLVTATFAALGPDWLHAVWTAPAASPRTLEQFLFVSRRALLPGILFWALPLAYLAARGAQPTATPLRLLVLVGGAAFLGASALSAKEGSYVYYYWEAYVVFGTLTCVALAGLGHLARGRSAVTAVAVLSGIVTLSVSVTQLAAPGRFSRLELATEAEAAATRACLEEVRTLPGPVFSEDRWLQLPWYAGSADVAPLDPVLYRSPRRAEAVGGGIGEAISRGDFATVLVTEHDRFGLAAAAREAGMTEQDTPPALAARGLRRLGKAPGGTREP